MSQFYSQKPKQHRVEEPNSRYPATKYNQPSGGYEQGTKYRDPSTDYPSTQPRNHHELGEGGIERIPLENKGLEQSEAMFPIIKASSHPLVSLVHILTKIGTVAIYLVLPLFTDSFLVKEVVVIVAAIDFWIVKNITGRLLVGLRWWVDFEENGEEKWKFECKADEKNVNAADDKIFWWTLALFTLIWLLLTMANILTLSITNLVITGFCLVMMGFNLYSYYKCSKVQS